MASIAEGQQPTMQRAGSTKLVAALLTIAAGVIALIIAATLTFGNGALASIGIGTSTDPAVLGAFGAAGLFLLLGGLLILARPGAGGGIALVGVIIYIASLLLGKTFGYALAVPLVLGFVGSLTGLIGNDITVSRTDPGLIYRQAILTRVTHWTWAIAMFFLLLTGLQIWNAHPSLYIGQQSGFQFDNAILEIGAENTDAGPRGFTTVFGQKFDTTGVLGMSGSQTRPQFLGFPGWATIPSTRDLATGRVIHFFFAWVLVGALAIWLVSSIFNGHFWRDIILKPRDFRELPQDIVDHVLLRFHHTNSYSPLQKIAYFSVFIILFPLIILTGLTMSPGMDAAWPWLLDLFGGRQTARTLHFLAMMLLVLFFIVHIALVVLAGPLNEMRSIITGYYRTSSKTSPTADEEKLK